MSNDSKYSLSRRKALLGLGTVGVAGAGAGVGTSALFSDTESFEDNTLTAGELNLIVDYGTSVDSTNASAAMVAKPTTAQSTATSRRSTSSETLSQGTAGSWRSARKSLTIPRGYGRGVTA